MDGVLFSSTNCHARAYAETFQEIGIHDFSYPPYAGVRTDEAVRRVLAEHNYKAGADELSRLVAQKQRLARMYLVEEGRVIAGARELLIQLRDKFLLALASSASRGTIDIFLDKLAMPENPFQVILDGSQVDHAKPAPDIYLAAAEQLGVSPDRCVVIEDSVSGVFAGTSAGMHVIGIEGTDTRQALSEAGATMVVESLHDILGLLKGK
jgi:HAD superfamily hydrolase (TIGR01509 family)